MKLKTKVLASFASIMILSLSVFGLYLVKSVENDGKNLLAAKIQGSINEINSLKESPITAAFNVATNSDYELLVGLYDSKGTILSFSETEIKLSDIRITEVIAGQNSAIEVTGEKTYLVRSIELSNGSFVILASSLDSLQESISELLNQLIIAVSVILSISLVLMYASMRKDLISIHKLSMDADAIANGELKAHLTPISGNSEVAELTRSISEMAESLQKNAEEMQQLLGDISHELKTPLSSIKGYVELLIQKNQYSEEQLQSFEVVQSEIEHMARLIDDILLMSKLGAINYDKSDLFDLGELVNQRFQILHDLQPGRALTIIDECEMPIHASLVLITRLLDNLVSNTLAHTLEVDEVRVTTCLEDGNWTIQYEDSGKGLPDSYLYDGESHFLRFDFRKSEGTGTGLGLSIIQQIVKQHGGELSVGRSYLGGLLLRITAPSTT